LGATSFKDLEVWRKAMDVAEAVYALARRMPKQEEYRLTAQMIRAAVSVPANIAEGHARATRRDYAHFISISRGSAAELETLLLLVVRAKFASEAELASLFAEVDSVSRMLNRLHARLKETPST
jgi:four helix bundle protein